MGADEPLEFFLMTSSNITIMDQPGQSNYAAANTFLEAFCQYRHGLGLPAATLSICPVDDVGFVADNKLIRKKLMANGIYFLPERETLDYFQLAIANQLAATGAELQQQRQQQHRSWASEGYTIMGLHSQVHLEDPKCATSWRRDRRKGTYHNVRDTAGASGAERGSGGGLKTFLEQHGRDDPGALVERESVDYIATEIGHRIFQFMMKDAADMDLSLTVTQIGMDSLMAIELRRWWKQTFGLDVSVLEIMGAGTLQQLGELAANGLKTKLAGE